jgi:pimeloyl-ACP methyl ester carboxylesterase
MSCTASERENLKTEQTGRGSPALIFVHGGACDRTDWSAQVRALSSKFEVITLDLPGHGDSGMPPDPSIGALARSVAYCRTLVSAGKSVLIGHSMACRVILETFCSSADDIGALIFVDGSVSAAEGDVWAVQRADKTIREMGVDRFLEYSFTQTR